MKKIVVLLNGGDMKFSEIVEHLSKRGFVTRKKTPNLIYFWGMDNSSKISYEIEGQQYHKEWQISLDEIGGDDWIVIPLFWGGLKDNFLPFDKNKKITYE